MALLLTKWFGVVVLEGPRVVDRADFPKDAEAIAERLGAVRRGEILEEERGLARPGIAVAEPRLASLGPHAPEADAEVAPPEGFTATLLHEAVLRLAERDLGGRTGDRDRFLAHAVRMLDEILTVSNTLVERLREWYGILDPAGARADAEPVDFVRRVAEREAPSPGASAAGLPAEELKALAGRVGEFLAERARLEKVVSEETREIAPNLTRVVGETVAARLIAQAGSLERLAYLPASTVQVLGAETALFDHLRQGAAPPKHGVLYQNPLVHASHPRIRGRVARVLAGKAALAARVDLFASSRDGAVGERLLGAVERRVAALRAHGVRTKAVTARPPKKGGARRARR